MEFKANGILQSTATDSLGRTKEMVVPVKFSLKMALLKNRRRLGEKNMSHVA